MKNNFSPNLEVDNVLIIKENIIKKFNYFFFDFDNTLMPWGTSTITEENIKQLNILKKQGKKIYIITNGKGERIKTLKKNIPDHIKVLNNAQKPRLRKIKQFVEENKIDPSKSLFIGDNLITDIYVGNKLGMYTIKVKPITKKEFWATKFYRIIESIIYFIYRKKFREFNGKSHNNR